MKVLQEKDIKTLDGKSMDIVDDNINKLKYIFPEVFCEDKVDFERLQEVLGNYIEEKEERYRFEWNGKSQAIRIAQTQSTGTLRPCKEESKNWDTTQNLYIEGDNLEVLKLLQKSYQNKIKIIYIDPPYNTGNDFIYRDDYKDNIKNYLETTKQLDDKGKKLSTNSELSGRYHTDWLNMIYPRLRLAKNLLTDDGVIFISIDDNEEANLKKVCDEIFGEVNCLGPIIQNKQNAKNDILNIQKNHEFIFAYRKTCLFDEMNRIKPTLVKKSITYKDAFEENGEYYYINDSITTRGEGGTLNSRPNLGYTVYYNPETNDKIGVCDYDVSLARISNSIEKVYKDDLNLLRKGYVAIRPPKVRGKLGCWTWSLDKFNQNNKNIIITGKHDSYSVKKRTFIPKNDIKYIDGKLKYIATTSSNSRSILEFSTNDGTNTLNEIMDEVNLFNNPKNLNMIKYLINLVEDNNCIILDFFSGSATTAHAVMKLNSEQNENRKFIMVQLPEKIEGKLEVYKSEYKNICDIGKERIRKSGDKIVSENKDKEAIEDLDIGFKVLKLDSSNIKKWNPDYDDLDQSFDDILDNFVPDRTEEDVVYEIMLKYGVDLTYPVEEEIINGKKVFSIGLGSLIICLDNNITLELIDRIVEIKKQLSPEVCRVVFKDNGFTSDSVKTNAIQILRRNNINEIMSI